MAQLHCPCLIANIYFSLLLSSTSNVPKEAFYDLKYLADVLRKVKSTHKQRMFYGLFEDLGNQITNMTIVMKIRL